MGFVSVLSFAHDLARQRIRPGDTAIDATAGNGNDTLLLARSVGRGGLVLAFDIQEAALERTGRKLTEAGIGWRRADRGAEAARAGAGRRAAGCLLVPASHAEMERWAEAAGVTSVAAVMFNLGYLPGDGADRSVITRAESTLPAMEAALRLLRPGGVLTAVLYPGHRGGDEEAAAVERWAAGLAQAEAQVLVYRFANAPASAPYLIAVEKKARLRV
jgi:SAM-dependent methyltransferase